jgi:hypothetical protein
MELRQQKVKLFYNTILEKFEELKKEELDKKKFKVEIEFDDTIFENLVISRVPILTFPEVELIPKEGCVFPVSRNTYTLILYRDEPYRCMIIKKVKNLEDFNVDFKLYDIVDKHAYWTLRDFL